jgi:hypothetical protein
MLRQASISGRLHGGLRICQGGRLMTGTDCFRSLGVGRDNSSPVSVESPMQREVFTDHFGISRWLQFSVRELLLLVLVVCVSLGWWRLCLQTKQQSAEIERLRRELARLHVGVILCADVSDETKVQALAPYVKPGDAWQQIECRLGGETGAFGHGPGFGEHEYEDVGLVVGTYPDGEVYGVGCYMPENGNPRSFKRKWLCADEPIAWPRSVERNQGSVDVQAADDAYLQCLFASRHAPK